MISRIFRVDLCLIQNARSRNLNARLISPNGVARIKGILMRCQFHILVAALIVKFFVHQDSLAATPSMDPSLFCLRLPRTAAVSTCFFCPHNGMIMLSLCCRDGHPGSRDIIVVVLRRRLNCRARASSVVDPAPHNNLRWVRCLTRAHLC